MLAPDHFWVSATATRNFCHADPLLDWLTLYGKAAGFVRDDELEGYDPETDMGLFMQEKGRAFEAAVMSCVREKFQVAQIASRSGDAQREDLYQQTLQAIEEGVEVIYQPVIWDMERRTFGIPDLLVRSDLLNRLVEQPVLSAVEEALPRHYRVVDVKFTNLDLTAKGFVGNDGGDRRRKAQLLIYNRGLGHIQGYEPPYGYLLGRSWKQTVKKVASRGDSCFERLAPADLTDPELMELVNDACAWVRRVRTEGSMWQVLPVPSVPELYPNMGNTQDSPWHQAKKQIGDELGEVTSLWQVSPRHRPAAHAAGVTCYRDPNCNAGIFGIADSYGAKLQRILEVYRSSDSVIEPAQISAGKDEWGTPAPLEFYVDFETVTDLDDDFSTIPVKGGQALIFMIGCGHVENGEWQFATFTCDRLSMVCEYAIIEAWHKHMADVQKRLGVTEQPMIFHWSHAERSFLDTAYNSARARHGASWPDLNWYDFLVKVVREEPVVVKGALAFGLKHVAKAMKRNGLIETAWEDGPGDGLAAMVGAWRCDQKAREQGISMKDLPLMQSIEQYNWVDCKVMQEIVSHLRSTC